MARAAKRAVTAAAEYGVARAGIAAVRALDHDVIGQAHHPRGSAGRLTGWEMAHRPSNRQRVAIASQPRCPGATAATSRSAASEIENLLTGAGFSRLSIQTLPLSPPVACVLAGGLP
jgi:hypothetical protein